MKNLFLYAFTIFLTIKNVKAAYDNEYEPRAESGKGYVPSLKTIYEESSIERVLSCKPKTAHILSENPGVGVLFQYKQKMIFVPITAENPEGYFK